MQLTFLGATETVTGSKYLLEFDNKKILIDCGLFQGYKELRLRNWQKLPIDAAQIDAVILTHAHIDHTGYLPLLVKQGFQGPIFATPATQDLCAILLPDSGHIQEEDAYFANKHGFSKHHPALPLYTQAEAEHSLKQFVSIPYQQPQALDENSFFTFLPAGHILGAAFVKIQVGNHSILFSGDIGRPHDPVIQAPVAVKSADFLVVESTYGDRLHSAEPVPTQLARIIRHTAKRGGSVIIPAFAVGRAQSLLYDILQLKNQQKIPDLPLFLDSPMATKATKILNNYIGEHRLDQNDYAALSRNVIYVDSIEESKKIDNYSMPIIVISASGMATGGRILHHLKAFAPESKNTLLFAGFQAAGTRGARILNGEREIKIHGAMIPIRARIESLSNTSAHADYAEILQWLSHFKNPPRQVFITHGELQGAKAFKARIKERFGWNCVIPRYQQTFNLI